MTRSACFALMLAVWPHGVCAQQTAASASLDEQQLLGLRLFNQSCRVCHTKPQLTSPLYGPSLSRQSLGGQEDVMREVISNGTPRMPGFRHHFEPAQTAAIASAATSAEAQPAGL